jgi:uncharacterized protein
LPEIWGGEMADNEAFADRHELQDFLDLLMRHWNSIVQMLEEEDVFTPLLFVNEEGAAPGNDWARGFTRGISFHHEAWKELFDDELYSAVREKNINTAAAKPLVRPN